MKTIPKPVKYKDFIIPLLLITLMSFTNLPVYSQNNPDKTAAQILGNPEYLAISYGGYRQKTRDIQPTLIQIKDDLKILYAMGIRVLRTYNVHLAEASNILKVIREMKDEDPSFEMYVMLGAWIDCKNAWTHLPVNHDEESDRNAVEIDRAVELANTYPDIVKIIAVGNEAMVKWATSYYVQPWVILKWVNHLQNLKKEGKLSKDLWVTSSDDFASWGGGDPGYHTIDLENLIKAVDYVSMHTYPYHNTHYNPDFWFSPHNESEFNEVQKAETAMERALIFAKQQYKNVKSYVHSISPDKPIHIGETGWASVSDGFYGAVGSKASDEYKQALYYQKMRNWTHAENISCFYFEAFDEPWKDSSNKNGSENHFGIFTVDGKAKFVLWNLVDNHVFSNLKRDGKTIQKTFSGDKNLMMQTVLAPPKKD
ncbi:MAG: glycosyl hydrolase family 17 [Saprospiraceae bacterium]|nr:glycosyl hydrolase family 17 [Saprospiraceae bacterium]